MNAVLDTHFLIWILTEEPRLDAFDWLERYRPWGVSPISFLELQFLHERGRLRVDVPALIEAVGRDPRFAVDEVPLLTLVEHAVRIAWTRDPFDRLLAAHSSARRAPLCTVDRTILASPTLVPRELRSA